MLVWLAGFSTLALVEDLGWSLKLVDFAGYLGNSEIRIVQFFTAHKALRLAVASLRQIIKNDSNKQGRFVRFIFYYLAML